MSKSLLEQLQAAKLRRLELHAKRAELQERLHARLAETGESRLDPMTVELRAAIKALQAELYDLDNIHAAPFKDRGARLSAEQVLSA